MRKILCLLLTLILTLSLLLSLSACGDEEMDGYVKYTEYGARYWLPEQMKEKKYPNITLAYSDGDAFLYIMCYAPEDLESMGLDGDISVKRYTDKLISVNDYDGVEYSLSEDRSRAEFAVTETVNVGKENEKDIFYYYIIARNEDVLYVFSMHCDATLKSQYEAEFLKWSSYVVIPKS